jgi:multidrug transporter EmrE-like cation transporter
LFPLNLFCELQPFITNKTFFIPPLLEEIGVCRNMRSVVVRIGKRSAWRQAMFTTLTGLAALSFSIGGYFMKLSAGLTHLGPTVLMFAFFSVGAVFQTVAMRGEEMAITYIAVLGFEAITAFALSVFLLNESSSISKFAGVGLVLAGIVLLRTGRA